jgi:hypothetical protein
VLPPIVRGSFIASDFDLGRTAGGEFEEVLRMWRVSEMVMEPPLVKVTVLQRVLRAIAINSSIIVAPHRWVPRASMCVDQGRKSKAQRN